MSHSGFFVHPCGNLNTIEECMNWIILDLNSWGEYPILLFEERLQLWYIDQFLVAGTIFYARPIMFRFVMFRKFMIKFFCLGIPDSQGFFPLKLSENQILFSENSRYFKVFSLNFPIFNCFSRKITYYLAPISKNPVRTASSPLLLRPWTESLSLHELIKLDTLDLLLV